jgi:hypothetical protein
MPSQYRHRSMLGLKVMWLVDNNKEINYYLGNNENQEGVKI